MVLLYTISVEKSIINNDYFLLFPTSTLRFLTNPFSDNKIKVKY